MDSSPARRARAVAEANLLEAGIAISALAVPLLLTAAGALYSWALGDQPTTTQRGKHRAAVGCIRLFDSLIFCQDVVEHFRLLSPVH